MEKLQLIIWFTVVCMFQTLAYAQDNRKPLSGERIELLKTTEAIRQGVDTTEHFREEMQRFRNELRRGLEQGENDPEFPAMMEEFRKGLLIFEITNREVWMKSYTDTAGLRLFFEQNKDRFRWDEPHFRGFVVHSQTKSDRERMQAETAGLAIVEAHTFLKTNYLREDTIQIKLGDIKTFTKGQDEYVDELIFRTGKGVPYLEFPRYFVIGELREQPQEYPDVLAEVMDGYQQYLESLWLEQLDQKK
ncbi:MAG: hypothetical protein LBS25_09980 [Candidatus Symbiothrix sp.]|jgi:peptidyl-prolyl cis-trans isomerase SurA|nr:hypothetical protein [Candidatus Symbiothrix sp.]